MADMSPFKPRYPSPKEDDAVVVNPPFDKMEIAARAVGMPKGMRGNDMAIKHVPDATAPSRGSK